jgi:predicted acyltransferase
MFGNLAGRWIAGAQPLPERVNGLFAMGALAIVAGTVWDWAFPINKNLWTSSYVVFTAGMASLTLATIMWLVDIRESRSWVKPFVIYGVNPLIAFVGSGIMARLIYSVIMVEYAGARVPLQSAIYQGAFASWLSPMNASLAFALAFVGVWLGILALLHRRRIFISV